MSQYSPPTLSLLVRLWFNTSMQCWQGEIKDVAGNQKIRFNGLDHLGQLLVRLTETEKSHLETKPEQDHR